MEHFKIKKNDLKELNQDELVNVEGGKFGNWIAGFIFGLVVTFLASK